MLAQVVVKWSSPLGSTGGGSAWLWREHLVRAHADAPWSALSVSRGTHSLRIISTDPEASQWLRANLKSLSEDATLGQLGPPNLISSSVCACTAPPTTYRVSMGVIARAGEAWRGMDADGLGGQERKQLEDRFARQIAQRLAVFGVEIAADSLCLEIVDDGHARPIRLQGGGNAHALARKDMVLRTAWRIQGELAVGGLTHIGYGRLFQMR